MTQTVLQWPEHVLSIQTRFVAFHEQNPWVLERLTEMTRELVARGRRRVGLKMLVEVVRWEHQRRTNDPTSDFRINNSYTSRYARLIMERNPDLAGVFETRALISQHGGNDG